MIPKANQLARGSSLGEIDLMLIDAIKANAHGRKVKDIHFDPYSENGVVKVGISFEEEKTDNVQDYSGLSDLEKAIHRGFLCAGVENVSVGIIKETAQECLTNIKPAEWSEDERIRKKLVEYHSQQFENNRDQEIGLFHKDALAYLEKQKDLDKMIVVSPEVWDNAISDAYENGKKDSEKQKEQKVDIDKLRRDLYQSGYNDCYQHGKEDAQKEQKPAECLKAEKDGWYVCIKDYYRGGKKQSSIGDLVQAKGGMYIMSEEDISEWFRRAYYEEVRDAFGPNTDTNIPEQKPAIKLVFPRFRVGDIIRNVHDEWDKTTKRISYVGEHGYNFDYRHLRGNAGGGSFGFCYEDYYELVEQKPAEWSEENYDKISKQVYKAIRKTLASLAVYSENEALLDSKEETLSYYSQQCAEKILKSLRPSWKPSEEQMEALERCIDYMDESDNDDSGIMLTLYEQLKELKEGEK